jgi:hypothetical protein
MRTGPGRSSGGTVVGAAGEAKSHADEERFCLPHPTFGSSSLVVRLDAEREPSPAAAREPSRTEGHEPLRARRASTTFRVSARDLAAPVS